MKKESIEAAKSWLNEQVVAIEKVNDKFKSQDPKDIKFKDLSVYPVGQRNTFLKGIDIEMTYLSKDKYVLKCWMDSSKCKPSKKVVCLPDHFHSDIRENFKIIEGEMRDNLDHSVILRKGDSYTYEKNINHEPSAAYCEIIITGHRV